MIIVKYNLLTAATEAALSDLVELKLSEGFQPFGSPSAYQNGNSINFLQAVVLTDDATPTQQFPPLRS